MGNGQQKKIAQNNKIFVKIRDRSIILHNAYKFQLNIGDAHQFPHQYEGFRLWDSNIILSRYIILNSSAFKNKSVLQLASGTGISGITAKKWTEAKNIIMTEQEDEVVLNIKHNLQKNQIDDVIVTKMKWNEYDHFKHKYDIILASDPFFRGCSFENFYNILLKFLVVGGKTIIATGGTKVNDFLKIVQEPTFQFHKQNLTNSEYLANPLMNKILGADQYKAIVNGQISIYVLTKKNSGFNEEAAIQQKQVYKFGTNDPQDKPIELNKKQSVDSLPKMKDTKPKARKDSFEISKPAKRKGSVVKSSKKSQKQTKNQPAPHQKAQRVVSRQASANSRKTIEMLQKTNPKKKKRESSQIKGRKTSQLKKRESSQKKPRKSSRKKSIQYTNKSIQNSDRSRKNSIQCSDNSAYNPKKSHKKSIQYTIKSRTNSLPNSRQNSIQYSRKASRKGSIQYSQKKSRKNSRQNSRKGSIFGSKPNSQQYTVKNSSQCTRKKSIQYSGKNSVFSRQNSIYSRKKSILGSRQNSIQRSEKKSIQYSYRSRSSIRRSRKYSKKGSNNQASVCQKKSIFSGKQSRNSSIRLSAGSYKINQKVKIIPYEQYSGSHSFVQSGHQNAKIEQLSNKGSFVAKSSGSYYSGHLKNSGELIKKTYSDYSGEGGAAVAAGNSPKSIQLNSSFASGKNVSKIMPPLKQAAVPKELSDHSYQKSYGSNITPKSIELVGHNVKQPKILNIQYSNASNNSQQNSFCEKKSQGSYLQKKSIQLKKSQKSFELDASFNSGKIIKKASVKSPKSKISANYSNESIEKGGAPAGTKSNCSKVSQKSYNSNYSQKKKSATKKPSGIISPLNRSDASI